MCHWNKNEKGPIKWITIHCINTRILFTSVFLPSVHQISVTKIVIGEKLIAVPILNIIKEIHIQKSP